MPKYKITIEFSTDIPLKFPQDAQILDAMQVQLESLEDGDISYLQVTQLPGKVEEVVDCDHNTGPCLHYPCTTHERK